LTAMPQVLGFLNLLIHLIMNKPALKEKDIYKEIPQEAAHLLEILDQIENHTADLRKKLMEELKRTNSSRVNLKLDEV
jgi:hypothetical protein